MLHTHVSFLSVKERGLVFLMSLKVLSVHFRRCHLALCWLWAVRIAEEQSSKCVLTGLLTNQMIFTWKYDSKLHEAVPENT